MNIWILVLLFCFVLFFLYSVAKRKLTDFCWIFKLKFFFYSLFVLVLALVFVYFKMKF